MNVAVYVPAAVYVCVPLYTAVQPAHSAMFSSLPDVPSPKLILPLSRAVLKFTASGAGPYVGLATSAAVVGVGVTSPTVIVSVPITIVVGVESVFLHCGMPKPIKEPASDAL